MRLGLMAAETATEHRSQLDHSTPAELAQTTARRERSHNGELYRFFTNSVLSTSPLT